MISLFRITQKDLSVVAGNLAINSQVLIEAYGSLFKNHLKIKKFKLHFDITEKEFLDLAYDLPTANTISEHLFQNLDFALNKQSQTKIKEAISFYLFLNSMVKIYRNLSIPLIRYYRESKSHSPLISWIKNKFPELKDVKFTSIDLMMIHKLDLIIRSVIEENLQDDSIYKMGRPRTGVQDYFMEQLKVTLTSEYKHYMPKIDKMNTFLRENYNSLFDELPVAQTAIKQAIERVEKRSIHPSVQTQN